MSLIEKPGIYAGMLDTQYHADPCPEPSLSRSLVSLLVERTPRHAWQGHPRLNPNYAEENEEEEKFNLGSAFHTALLSRGAKIHVVDAADWRTNAAKAERADARARGETPLLVSQAERVMAMVEAVREQLPDFGLGHLFTADAGLAEQVVAWNDPVAGWCRCMLDWMDKDTFTVTDLKSTSLAINAATLGRHCSNMLYEVQQAFYSDGVTQLLPDLKGRLKFRFLFVEDKPPFAIMPVILPGDAIAKGEEYVRRAKHLWAASKASNKWPRFSGTDVAVEYPPWATAEFSAYDESGE